MIFILIIACTGSLDNTVEFHKSILIKFFKLFVRNNILIGIKIIEVAEAISCCVSDLSVVIADLLKNFGADTNIGMIICACYPKSENVGTVLVNNFLWVHAVSERLGHLSALAVNSPAVSNNLLIRSTVTLCNRGKK